MGAAGEFAIDGILHRFRMFQDIIVGEADNPDVMGKQCLAALLVISFALLVVVLATVGLDSQTRGQTTEIDDVAGNRHLPAKVISIQFTATQQIPELLFGIGGRMAHSPRQGDQSSAMVAFTGHAAMLGTGYAVVKAPPPPQPSPGVPGAGEKTRLKCHAPSPCLLSPIGFGIFPGNPYHFGATNAAISASTKPVGIVQVKWCCGNGEILMKAQALICDATQKFTLQEVILEDMKPDQVTIKTHYTGISIGTEFALIRNKVCWGPYPLCTGYMGTGVIIAVGGANAGI